MSTKHKTALATTAIFIALMAHHLWAINNYVWNVKVRVVPSGMSFAGISCGNLTSIMDGAWHDLPNNCDVTALLSQPAPPWGAGAILIHATYTDGSGQIHTYDDELYITSGNSQCYWRLSAGTPPNVPIFLQLFCH